MTFAELEPEPASAYTKLDSGPFKGMERDDVSAMLLSAIEANRLDLYLQPMVTLPQRKVRFYEALTRLRTGEGATLTPTDFLPYAEEAGLMPRIDNLMLFRCVQVMRRLQAKNREIGMFCNVSASTLIDPEFFPQFSEFMDANRALAPSLVLEFTQAAYRSFGPMENESLAALAGRGFRFSMDNVSDLRLEPRDLGDRGFRFLKVPASLLLDRTGATVSDIHPADLSGLLLRFGVELVGEKIESEGVVVDLLDYDVKYGQGFLFSPPRPVRAEIMQAIPDRSEAAPRGQEPPKSEPAKPTPPETVPVRSPVAADARSPAAVRAAGLGQLARSVPARS
jgi:cyclic-di-GMP phosphodiesterase, flagellum assembly factor TipF